MIVLGLTAIQCKILKSVQTGESYTDIANDLGLGEEDVIVEEVLALAILARRWKKPEFEVKQALKGLLLLLLSLLPMFEGVQVERVVRVRPSASKTVKGGRKLDFDMIDV